MHHHQHAPGQQWPSRSSSSTSRRRAASRFRDVVRRSTCSSSGTSSCSLFSKTTRISFADSRSRSSSASRYFVHCVGRPVRRDARDDALDADAARLHQKRTLVADVAEELAAFRQRCGRWLRNLRERISARAELPPRGMERSPRGAKHHSPGFLLAGLQRPCSCLTCLFNPVHCVDRK